MADKWKFFGGSFTPINVLVVIFIAAVSISPLILSEVSGSPLTGKLSGMEPVPNTSYKGDSISAMNNSVPWRSAIWVGVQANPTSNLPRRSRNISYFKDDRSGLCFAEIYRHRSISIASVPCEAVEHLIINN